MKTQSPNPPLIAVIGDVHHHIGLAAQGLREIESEMNRPITQVFSVGDFGLFLHETDWDFLSGPSKYRQPENSPKIRAAWAEWTWPISIIASQTSWEEAKELLQELTKLIMPKEKNKEKKEN